MWSDEVKLRNSAGILFSPDSRFLLLGAQPMQSELLRGFGGRGDGTGRGGRPTRARQNAGSRAAKLYDLDSPQAAPREIELPNRIGWLSLSANSVWGLPQGRSTDDVGNQRAMLTPIQFDIDTGMEIPFEHEVSRPLLEGRSRGGSDPGFATVNAEGTLLLTALDGSGFQVWSLNDSAAAPQEFDMTGLTFARFAPDGRHLLVGLSSLVQAPGSGLRDPPLKRFITCRSRMERRSGP